MKHPKISNAISLGCLTSLLLTASAASADQRLRIPRPGEADKQTQQVDKAENTADTSTRPSTQTAMTASETSNSVHKANASLNVDDLAPNPLSTTAIFDWQSKNLPKLQDRTGATTDNTRHKGLKSHLGGALSVLGNTVGTVANTVVPITNVGSRIPYEPKITVEAGHCPAVNDPAFQIPKTWWNDLAQEEGSALLGPQWKFWLTAVKNVFQAHAQELHETPGVAALHVMINPNGSILNITPYTGSERENPGVAINIRTMEHLRAIIISVGKLPPFPQGSKVGCYHLIFDGSAG